jgi:hypothetical protein
MLISCGGCGRLFKRSGFRMHQQRSNNPPCKTKVTDPQTEAVTAEDIEMAVDPRGDHFGDYTSYLIDEHQLDIDSEEDNNNTSSLNDSDLDSDSDQDDDEFAAALAEQENGLEPDRRRIPVPDPNCDMNESSQVPALHLRGGAETGLQKEPFVVKFTQGQAAAVYSQTGLDNNAAYAKVVGDSNNPYSPFTSKLEWELAYWDKIQGPSSTAFTNLMSIEGVRRYLLIIK